MNKTYTPSVAELFKETIFGESRERNQTMKRHEIRPICRIVEGASQEDIDDGFGYESGYSILDNQVGDYLYDFAGTETMLWYQEHNYELSEDAEE